MITGKEAVFPQVVGVKVDVPGVDLRIWMATQFMATLLADHGLSFEVCAKQAVQACDRLIAELNKPQEAKP
jgi:hypothetical protein